jgi:hypothetical protein
MVVTLLMTAALVAAVVTMALRRRSRRQLRLAATTRPGATPEQAIWVRSFTEIDDHLGRRWCHCGGFLERTGEGTRQQGDRRYRIARLCCQECEDTAEVWFDTTEVVH